MYGRYQYAHTFEGGAGEYDIYIQRLEPPDDQGPVWEFRIPVLDAVLLERPL